MDMDTQLKAWAASSADPTEVSNRIKGAILAASAIIIFVAASAFHITLTPDNVVAFATDMSMIGGAIWAVWGILHAGVRYFGSK